ncbi:DUF3048 domain-containing protein [Paenibacillus solisilvae]|uniref:DUF3048 domain-containing protein n=1 Tax=Paenibacillus solisilvae TaxID=2486751 RepID=A0ABW0W147_9BACL
MVTRDNGGTWFRTSTITLFVLMLLAAGLLAGCGGNANATNNKTEPLTENTDPVVPIDPPAVEPEPVDPPSFIAPLTGLALPTEPVQRPFAVMVNNFSAARPQSGLPHADMVWEVLAEGGITRLVAIFQSDNFTDPIGPIRSNRPYLIRIGEALGGVLVHAGASNDGYDVLQHQHKAYLDEITNAGSYFYRESFRKAPHNLYSNLEKLREGALKKKYDQTVTIPTFPFSDAGATAAGVPAASVNLNFLLKDYKVSYAYDEATKLYLRSINGEPHTDLTTGDQLSATNLVVLGAKHKTYDDYGRLEVNLESGGPAVLIQLGKAVECTWVRSDDDVIRLMKDGQELPFVPGKTFYHIVPLSPTFAGHVSYS